MILRLSLNILRGQTFTLYTGDYYHYFSKNIYFYQINEDFYMENQD